MPIFRQILFPLAISSIFWFIGFSAEAQTQKLDIHKLHQEAHYFNQHLMPDSVLMISNEILPHSGDYQNDRKYWEILKLGTQIALLEQNHSLSELYLSEIIKSDLFENDNLKKGKLYLDVASRLLNMHEYGMSMNYCNKAYECYTTVGYQEGKTEVLLLMHDNSYFSQEDSTNMAYLDQAFALALLSGDSSLLSEVYFTFGKAYYRNEQYVESIANYTLARQTTPEEDLDSYLRICIYQELVYTLCDSVAEVCDLSEFIIQTSIANGYDHNLSNGYLGRAYCCAKRGLIDSTQIYLDLSEEWRSKTPKVKASPGYYNQMYVVSMIIYDYDRALRYLETKAAQQNQINRNNRGAALGDARAEFDYELQKAKIGELKAQNETINEKAKRRKTTIMGIIAVLLISIVAYLNIRRQYKTLGLSYKSLVKKHIEVDNLNHQLLKEEKKKESKRSGFHIKNEDKILEKMKTLIEDDLIYKNPNISLILLSEKLDTNTTYLSTIINKHYHMHFKSFINKYRIDEARKILVSEKGNNYSIEGIANEVGFQSRSVFYQTFRQITGLTPTAYVKTYKSVCPDS